MDRNSIQTLILLMERLSLSARRAWIEICGGVSARPLVAVALRKESVDRNNSRIARRQSSVTSLSARRAWIEIACPKKIGRLWVVALRKESVDRNHRLYY